MTDLHLVEPGASVDLSEIDPGDTSAAPGDKHATRDATELLRVRLVQLQELLWAQGRHRVLVVLQGMDGSGKGGTIKKVFRGVDPTGLHVVSFKAPSEEELAHDYLWRIHPHVPADGQLVLFDRSHYEDVLIVRVQGLVPERRWRRRYEHICAFERLLVDEGTTLIKVMLHISSDQQAERLRARLEDPTKRWKFRRGDLEQRERWDDYQAAFAEAIERTSTPDAPWHVVPADRKWYRDWAVATIVTSRLEAIDMRWPEAEEDLDGIVIE